MSLISIEGICENGKIELAEQPKDVRRARVVVTFLPEAEFASHGAEQTERQAAIERMLARMHEGIDFGGEKFDRNAVYEDRLQQLEGRRG